MYYTKQLQADGKFLIIDALNQVIKTHRSTSFVFLSEHTADILCNDLNEIHAKNSAKHKQSSTDHAEQTDSVDYSNELRESFAYCLLSTIIENAINNQSSRSGFDLNQAIQWDMLFRITPQPPRFQEQHALVASLKPLLSSEWVDLPLNYSSSLEEMTEDETMFVPENILNELQSIIDSFTWSEHFIMELLFHFTECFSITAVIFWVSNKIDDVLLNDLFRVFFGEEMLETKTIQSKWRSSFFMARLDYLRKVNTSITTNDESLLAKLIV